MLTEKDIRFKKKVYFASCLVIFAVFGIVPAYAGPLSGLITNVLGVIISGITSLVVGLLDIVAKFFLEAMSYPIASEIMGETGRGFFEGFNSFARILRDFAVMIAVVILMWQVISLLVGPFVNAKQSQSIGGVITRTLVFIPLAYAVQPLAVQIIGIFQSIYMDFAAVNGAETFEGLSAVIPLDLAAKLGIGVSGIDASLSDVAGVLLSGIFIAGISWQFIKLLLEMAQRMVVMVVYAYLSPLAVVCGVGANTINIAKQALSTFFTAGILWVLNVWCLQGAIIMFNKCPVKNSTATPGEFFSWVVLTYAMLKIIQQIDDIFNSVGASNVRFSGSIIDDLLSMRQITAAVGGAIGGIRKAYSGVHSGMSKYAENGILGAVAGRSASNPAGPTQAKGINGFMKRTAAEVAKKQEERANATATPAFASASGIKNPNVKKTPNTATGATNLGTAAMYTGAALKTLGKSTLLGKAVSGFREDGKNLQAIADNIKENADTIKGNNAQVAINRALNAPTPQARAEAFKRLAAENPDYLHHDAAKSYLGEAMGLSENQKVVGMHVNKDGELSARVATTEDNKTILSSVNLADKDWSQPSVRPDGMDAVSTAASFNAKDVHTTQGYPAKAQDLGGDTDIATVQFPSDKFNGCLISEPQDIEGSDLGKYRIKDPSGGEHFITAPKGLSDEEIMSVVSGNAPQMVQDKFTAAGMDMAQYDAVRSEMGITSGEGVSATITKMPESSVPNQSQFKIETSDGQSFVVEGSRDAKAEDMAEFISTTDFRSDMERHFTNDGVDIGKLDNVREKIGVDDYVTGIITSPTTERVRFEDAIRKNEDGTVDFAVAGAATNGEPVGVKLSEGDVLNIPGSDFDGLKKVHLSTTTGERQEHYVPPELSTEEFAAMIMGEGTQEMKNKFYDVGKTPDMAVITSRGMVYPEEDWRHDRGNNTVFARVDSVPDIPTYDEVGHSRDIRHQMDSGIAGSTDAKVVFEAADGNVVGTLERSDSPASKGFAAWKFTGGDGVVSEFEVDADASARAVASDFLHEKSTVYEKSRNSVENISRTEYVRFESRDEPSVEVRAADGSVWSSENIIINGTGPKIEVVNENPAPNITVESVPNSSRNKLERGAEADFDSKYQYTQSNAYQPRHDIDSEPIRGFEEQENSVHKNKNNKRNKSKKRFNGNSKDNPARPQ